MARAIFSNKAERKVGDEFIAAAMAEDWELGLFVNDIEPDEDTALADLDEPSASWYAAQEVTYATAITEGGTAVVIPTPVVFEYDGMDDEESVYGWFYRHPTDEHLFIVRRFDDAPRPLGPTTDPLWVFPTLGFKTTPAE